MQTAESENRSAAEIGRRGDRLILLPDACELSGKVKGRKVRKW